MTATTTGQATTDADQLRRLLALADIVTPMALRVAATLGLVDLLLAGVNTVPDLAGATETDPDALARLVRHLVGMEVLSESAEGTIMPTELGMVLAEEHGSNQRSWLDLHQAIGRADLDFAHLLSAVRTGGAVHRLAHGRTFWEDLSADAELSASFDRLLGGRRDDVFDAAVAAYDWSSARHVADIGGGVGSQLAALLRAQPGLRGTLVELAGPLERARENLTAAGVADRCELLAGDFFAELPTRADTIMLSRVLHDWPDEDAALILRRCRDAMEPGGRILLLERAVGELAADPAFTSMDLRMLVYLGGRERTAADWTALADRVDMDVESMSEPFGFGTSVICLRPRSSTRERLTHGG